MSGGDIVEDRPSVVLPIGWQFGSLWIFTARHFHGDFKAVGVDVVEVLHSTYEIIPIGAISDSIFESSTANVRLLHGGMPVSVVLGEGFEHIIIGRGAVNGKVLSAKQSAII